MAEKIFPPSELLLPSEEFLLCRGKFDVAEERELLSAASRGDEGALREILRRFRGMVVNLAYQMVGNLDDAEDIAQEAFLRMLRFAHRFKGGSLKAWLCRLTVNLCLDHLKRRPKEEALNGSATAPSPDLDEAMAVRWALSKLPPHLRAVLILRELHQLEYAEIAEALRLPLGTVKSRLAEARRKFKEIWLSMWEGEK